MKKKTICVFICFILFVTNLSMAQIDNTENFESEDKILDFGIFGIPFYAYVAKDGFGFPEGPCSFLPNNPGDITSIAPTGSGSWIAGATWAVGKWYGCEFGTLTGNPFIWIIDETTGAMNVVGNYDPGGSGINLNGLAYDPTMDNMYGCSGKDLYTIDMGTGASTHVGSFGFTWEYSMIGIAFDGSGNLYGVTVSATQPSNLYSIDTSTGEVSIIGSTELDLLYAQDIAFDIDNDKLYLAANVGDFDNGKLYLCNHLTGETTLIGPFENSIQLTGFAISYSLSPKKPNKPTGNTKGEPGIEYTYYSWTTDPEEDDVYYLFDWGDGTDSGWIGPFPHDTTQNASHKWDEQGNFEIIVKAKDVNGEESDWSDPLVVSMPKNKVFNFNFPLLKWLFERFPNAFPILRYLVGS